MARMDGWGRLRGRATIEERVPLENAGSLSAIRGAFISASHYYDPDADPEGGMGAPSPSVFMGFIKAKDGVADPSPPPSLPPFVSARLPFYSIFILDWNYL